MCAFCFFIVGPINTPSVLINQSVNLNMESTKII